MSRRRIALVLLIVLFVLRFDLWQTGDTGFVFGLPAGLTYHVGYCLAAAAALALAVRHAWPQHLEAADDREETP